jgi:hypothetical protein
MFEILMLMTGSEVYLIPLHHKGSETVFSCVFVVDKQNTLKKLLYSLVVIKVVFGLGTAFPLACLSLSHQIFTYSYCYC